MVFAFGPDAEKSRPHDGVLRNYWSEKGVDLVFMSISSVLGTAMTVSDEEARRTFANDIGKALVEMNAPDIVVSLFKKTFKKEKP